MLKFVVALLLLASPAFADVFLYPTKHVKTLIVYGHAAQTKEALEVLEITKAFYLSKFNLSIDIIDSISIPVDMTGDDTERMAKWQIATKASRESRGVGLTLVILSAYPSSVPSIEFANENVLGRASDIGNLGQIDSLAYVKIVGSAFVASRILIHEVGHLAGGFHTSDGGIMAPYAEQNQICTDFSATSKHQIETYISSLP